MLPVERQLCNVCPMTLQTLVRDVEDFSVGTLEVLARHRLVTLGDVLRWAPDGGVHQFVVDNIAAIFEDLGYVWPQQSIH